MSDAQITELVSRVAGGQGVESALAAMGVESNAGCEALKRHPTARMDIEAAKATLQN